MKKIQLLYFITFACYISANSNDNFKLLLSDIESKNSINNSVIITTGDYIVENIDSLLNALKNAKSGEIIYIPGDIVFNLTARVYIDQLSLILTDGVTIASNRGFNGSEGALIFSDALDTKRLFDVIGDNARISGIRIQGPNPHRYMDHYLRSFSNEEYGREYFNKFPLSVGIYTEMNSLEVNNCEISGFSHAGVYLQNGNNHIISNSYIHDSCYNGYGYGICLDTASAIIERNSFKLNRHSIAGTGREGCSYIARYNIDLGSSFSHVFDMHGDKDRIRNEISISGDKVEIYENIFASRQVGVRIRGIPAQKSFINNNIFIYNTKNDGIIDFGNVQKDGNYYLK